MKLREIFIAVIILLAFAGIAIGAITADEAKKLGTTLTAVGAEKAGNKDGSIPEYTGGLTTIPPGFKKGTGLRSDPFADEKPLFTINQQNMGNYSDKLNDGQKTMLKKYPGYRMDVYKTHRTVTYPAYVLENTIKQSVTTKTVNNYLGLAGAHAAFPFPIPNNGYEAMWNHISRYQANTTFRHYPITYVVTSSGRPTLTSKVDEVQNFPYWKQGGQLTDNVFLRLFSISLAPARINGEMTLVHESLTLGNRLVWQYLPGQRRTKLAPDIAFDTPNAFVNGFVTYDEWNMFNGSMERFNFKLIGKKEMYVPYNNYKMVYWSTKDTLFTPKYLNPDIVRWELHRVWVVEADLLPGKRHIFSKRMFYLDEDSWTVLASEEYDVRGQLQRAGFSYIVQNYDAVTPYTQTYAFYDFNANAYLLDQYTAETGGVQYIKDLPGLTWNPDAMAGMGVR